MVSTTFLRTTFRHLREALTQYVTAANGERIGDERNQPLYVRAWEHEAAHVRELLNVIGAELRRRPAASGTCRFCNCTALHACVLGPEDFCAWSNREKTVCSHADCESQAARHREAKAGAA